MNIRFGLLFALSFFCNIYYSLAQNNTEIYKNAIDEISLIGLKYAYSGTKTGNVIIYGHIDIAKKTDFNSAMSFLNNRANQVSGKGELESIINAFISIGKKFQNSHSNLTNSIIKKSDYEKQLQNSLNDFVKLVNENNVLNKLKDYSFQFSENDFKNDCQSIISNSTNLFKEKQNKIVKEQKQNVTVDSTKSEQKTKPEDQETIKTSEYLGVFGFVLSIIALIILIFLFYKYFNKPKEPTTNSNSLQIQNINELQNQIETLKKQISSYNGNTAEIQKLKSQQTELLNLFTQLTASNELTTLKNQLNSLVNQINTKSDSKDVSQIKEQLNLLASKINKAPDNTELSSLKTEINKLAQTTPTAANKTELEQLKNQINELVNKINENDIKQVEMKIFERVKELVLSLFSQLKPNETIGNQSNNEIKLVKTEPEKEQPLQNRKIDFYLPIPDMKAFFWKDQSLIKPDSESYYAISYKDTNQNSAYFRLMETKIQTSLKDADICLKPVCEDVNKIFSGNSLIIKAEGELRLSGEKWELVKKCKIQVY